MDKIITIELTGKGDTYSVVTLPLTPYELLDTLDKLRMTPQDEPDWEICQHLAHRELHDWIGDGSVYELNALCTKLTELNAQESTVFEGLVEMEKEKGQKIIPMHRLLDLAYSTGQCHLLDEVHTVEQLGRFAAENGFVPEADDLSDKAFELLDFKKLGDQFMRGEGGVIVRGGYVAQDGDLAQNVWKTLALTPRKPDYAVLVELIAPEPSDNVTLALPATAEALTKAMTLTNARDLSETPCLCLDCRAPALRDMITDANSLADACRAAESLASLSDAELPKYKALLAAMEIRDLHEAIELSQRLDDYTLSPEQSDYEDIARGQLLFMLGKRELETLLPHVNLYQYGRALQDRHQLALTDYGSVERRDNRSLMQPKGLTADSDGIAIDGHIGTWHVIDEALCTRESDGETVRCFLLEHDKRGNTTENLIVNEAKALVLDDVWNGFQDLAEAGWTVQPVERQEQDTPSMQQM